MQLCRNKLSYQYLNQYLQIHSFHIFKASEYGMYTHISQYEWEMLRSFNVIFYIAAIITVRQLYLFN